MNGPLAFPVIHREILRSDVIGVVLNRGWGDMKKLDCRLFGVRKHSNFAIETQAQAAIRNWFRQRDEGLMCRSLEAGKYQGRFVGDFYHFERPHLTLSQYLLAEELVRPYTVRQPAQSNATTFSPSRMHAT